MTTRRQFLAGAGMALGAGLVSRASLAALPDSPRSTSSAMQPPEEPAARGVARIEQRTVVTMARLVALVLGLLSMGGFLLAGTESRINVLAFLFVFVFLQLALCGLGLLVMIRSLRGNPPTVLPVNPARFALDRLFPDQRYLREQMEKFHPRNVKA